MKSNTLKQYINFTNLTIDLHNRTTSLKDDSLKFTDPEWLLLACLAEANKTAVSNENIMLAVWQTQYKTDTVVRQLVKLVRDKIMHYETRDPIQNIRGKGYILNATGSDSAIFSKSFNKRKILASTFVSLAILVGLGTLLAVNKGWFKQPRFLSVSNISEYDIVVGNAIRIHVSNDERFSLIEKQNIGNVNNTILLYDNVAKELVKEFPGIRPTWSPNNNNFAYAIRDNSINPKSGVGYTNCDIFLGNISTTSPPVDYVLPCDFSQAPTAYPFDMSHSYQMADESQLINILPQSWDAQNGISLKTPNDFSKTIQSNFDFFPQTIFLTDNRGVYISINPLGEIRRHNTQTGEIVIIGKNKAGYTKTTVINNHVIFVNDKNGLNQIDIATGEISSLLDPQPETISELTSNNSALYITIGEPVTDKVYRLNKGFEPVGEPIGKNVVYLQGASNNLYFLSKIDQTWRLFKYAAGTVKELFDINDSIKPHSIAVYDDETFVILTNDKLLTKNKTINIPNIFENVRFIDKQHVVFDTLYFGMDNGSTKFLGPQVFKFNIVTEEHQSLIQVEDPNSDTFLTYSDRANPIPWKNGVIVTRAQTPTIFFQPENEMMYKISDKVNAPLDTNRWEIYNESLYYTDRSTRKVKIFDLNNHQIKEMGVLTTGKFTQVNGTFYGLIETKQDTRVLKVDVTIND